MDATYNVISLSFGISNLMLGSFAPPTLMKRTTSARVTFLLPVLTDGTREADFGLGQRSCQ